MYLRSLYLKNVRLYDEAFFEFSSGINVIHGPNARGKTTILEAIYLLIAGRSFRTSRIGEMLKQGADRFVVEACFEKHGIEQKLKISGDGKEKSIIYNSTPCRTYAELFGLMQGVAMTPDDVALVKGAPEIRRQFLDLQLAQVDPLYVHHLSRYNRAMKNRNLLLRSRKEDSIASWELEMGKAAAYIVHQRRRAAKELQQAADQVHHSISGAQEKLAINYRSSAPEVDSGPYFLDMWKRHRPREMELGFTISGPHKDDVQILVGGQEVRYFGSEGQQRSSVASLRLAGWQQLRYRTDIAPLMLVDDVGVSLDNSRRRELFSYLTKLKQVFLTTTEELDFPGIGLSMTL